MAAATSEALQRAKFLFDLNGFLRLRAVLSRDEVAAANAAVSAHGFAERGGAVRNAHDGTPFVAAQGHRGRLDMGGMLGWAPPHREVFRSLLCHPKLVPYLNLLVGEGYRLDHSPLVIAQERGSEGFSLHGGNVDARGRHVPQLQYTCAHGDIVNSLVAVSFQLTDAGSGDGGFCVVRGSHKMSFPPSEAMMSGLDSEFLETCVEQPETRAGDVVIFSEATVHGALPWTAEHQRRIALYRFAPANLAFARGYAEGWPESHTEGMTPAQLAVMQKPFHPTYDRSVLRVDADGQVQVVVNARSEAKKSFDRLIFGTTYF